jgi:hypothetical protein
MALKKQIILKSNFGDDVVFYDAYIKISSFTGNKEKIEIYLSIYKSKDDRFLENKTLSFTPSLEGDNFIKQGYQYLKTLPEFAGAIDC